MSFLSEFLSERSGVNVETIRYYEKIGVMPIPAAGAGGYRVYDLITLDVCIEREVELGLASMNARAASSGRWTRHTCGDVHGLTIGILTDIRQRSI